MKDVFSRFHPIVNLLYLMLMLGFTMFLQQPVCLGISIVSAMLYGGYLCGKRMLRFFVCYLLPTSIMILLVNPLVNHRGITILGHFPNGNPFTLESILYGMVAAAILAGTIQWFFCLHQIMTTDKLVYLFGRIFPSLSLVIAMTLRFVPRYQRQFKAVSEAQRQLGRGLTEKKWILKMRNGIRILSIMLTWAMEHAVETAASMKCRGYGLPGRTAYSLYRWRRPDTGLLILILLLGGFIGAGVIQGSFTWTCFPRVVYAEVNGYTIWYYIAYGILAFLPMLMNGKEEWRWKSFG
ncbi:MAG: energy-coupling factor transporter transmembrane protein EcfT [Bacteroides sp.]|nr:energy-coupling factor transporter transmembrane protein EcfT [Bacteroides sp.]MCM1549566.1 energy-coupling factor transporter transmembrane protein EcfT [Clostridium sp.]